MTWNALPCARETKWFIVCDVIVVALVVTTIEGVMLANIAYK